MIKCDWTRFLGEFWFKFIYELNFYPVPDFYFEVYDILYVLDCSPIFICFQQINWFSIQSVLLSFIQNLKALSGLYEEGM
jgi:hypothetical protein